MTSTLIAHASPHIAAEQPATHWSAAEIGRSCFSGSASKPLCIGASQDPTVIVTASSSQQSAQNVLLPGGDRFWQSNGQMNTHWLELEVHHASPEPLSNEQNCLTLLDSFHAPEGERERECSCVVTVVLLCKYRRLLLSSRSHGIDAGSSRDRYAAIMDS